MTLTEEQIRAKVIELLDGKDMNRMNMWLFSGITAQVLNPSLVEKVLGEEIGLRSHEVQAYWQGECPCGCAI